MINKICFLRHDKTDWTRLSLGRHCWVVCNIVRKYITNKVFNKKNPHISHSQSASSYTKDKLLP